MKTKEDARQALPAVPPDHQIWAMKTVEAVTSLGHSAIYVAIQDGAFPAPIRISRGRVGWIAAEVLMWLEECKAERDQLFAERDQAHREDVA